MYLCKPMRIAKMYIWQTKTPIPAPKPNRESCLFEEACVVYVYVYVYVCMRFRVQDSVKAVLKAYCKA